MQIDLQINARWIVTVDAEQRILEHHSLFIHQGRIVDMLPQSAEHQYTPSETIERDHHALLPGFINAHSHAAMSLLKGLADDLPLERWLNDHIWPAEAALADEQFVADGTRLAIAEMIKSGTTCFNDMYFFIDQTAREVEKSGVRANIGIPIIDFPTRWASHLDEYISKGLVVHDQYKSNPLITFSFAPHAPYTVSDTSFERIIPLIAELGVTTHIHLHETSDEVNQAVQQTGKRPIQRLNQLGLIGPDTMCVHMCALKDEDIALLAQQQAHVVHCPESNLKLASGICPVPALLEAGVNVALGTDGSASNNDLDMLGEMRTAALLAKGTSQNARVVSAHQAIEMATINGAKALGLDHEIGSIEVGKSADLISFDLNTLETQPVYDVASTIVYSASRQHINDVWVAAKPLMKNKHLTTLNEPALITMAEHWQKIIAPYHQHPQQSEVE